MNAMTAALVLLKPTMELSRIEPELVEDDGVLIQGNGVQQVFRVSFRSISTLIKRQRLTFPPERPLMTVIRLGSATTLLR